MVILFSLIAFVAGLFVGSHNSAKIDAERAKLATELSTLKSDVSSAAAAVKAKV